MLRSGLMLGIDLGGTKTEGVVLGGDGTELVRKRVATVQGSYRATLRTIKDLVADLETEVGQSFRNLGLGIPGSISPDKGLVRNANSTWINGKPFQADLSRVLAKQIRIENDANCLALSEAKDGAAAGASSVFAVILGTGVGGGIVIGDQIVTGANGLAGEWGHNILPSEEHPAPRCFCGKRGCLETYLSGPGILRDFAALGGASVSRVEAIVDLAAQGDALARKSLGSHLQRLGKALGAIVNILDPEVIVLGGGVSHLPGLVEALPDALMPFVFETGDQRVNINIQKAAWGDSSGVRGAARLWEHEND